MKIRSLILLSLLALLPFSGSAQLNFDVEPEGKEPFEVGKWYFGASLSSLNLSYSGASKTNFGVAAKVGYLVDDNLMLLFDGGFNHDGNDGIADYMHVGLGARYYIQQNGLFLGANCQYAHARHNYNDVMPGVEVGSVIRMTVVKTVTNAPVAYSGVFTFDSVDPVDRVEVEMHVPKGMRFFDEAER